MELLDIQKAIQNIFKKHVPPLQIRKENEATFEVAGMKEAIQGKQKVDGYYFGSVAPKPKDIRLYYFPIYTHPSAFEDISAELRKYLRGKSCFHIKKLSDEHEKDIEKMILKGLKVYLKEDLI